ncbi:MAG: RNA methyltransferase [Desulfobacterales bacterium]|nr:RNA methyltransferase [Desulfobacterales bacterium]
MPDRLDRTGLQPGPGEISEITPLAGGIGFATRLETACLANLFSGSPTRILMRIADFKADRFSVLERQTAGIDWELFLPEGLRDKDLSVQVTTRKSRLYHTDAVAERIRPIVLNHLTGQTGGAVSGRTPQPQMIMVRAENDRFTLSLDMSGAPLYKRGIKTQVVHAPLRETLAYAVLKRLKFSRRDILMDPMCGSGTFSLEAAMIQASAPPGLFRRFAFESWPGFKAKSFAHAGRKITAHLAPPSGPAIFASDLNPAAIESLKKARSGHPVFQSIQAACEDFFDIKPPNVPQGQGVVVLNPPYGKRLGKDMDIRKFYREISRKLTGDFKGFRAGIIYPEKYLTGELGLKLTPMPLFHGGLDLFAGIGEIP